MAWWEGFLLKCKACPGSTPSVIACGDATFPKGTALAMAGNFAAVPKGVPLGELSPQATEGVSFP